MKRTMAVLLLVALLGGAPAAKRKRERADFDYYVLALAWAPTFCIEHPSDRSSECRVGNRTTFVLHGLWPQAEAGPPPMDCGGSPVAQRIVQLMLNYMPSASLIQHEWMKHGTCSGLSAEQYFGQARQAAGNLRIPDEVGNLTRATTLDTRHRAGIRRGEPRARRGLPRELPRR